jgi:type IV secretory pathway VirB2 component (pilin)
MQLALVRHVVPALVSAVMAASAAAAATPPAAVSHGYDRPAQAILDVLHAPAPPVAYLSPTRQAMLLVA